MFAGTQHSEPPAAATSRRLLLLAGVAAGMLMLTAGFAMACTVYQGVLTVEGADGVSYSLVGHTGNSNQSDFMNRCEAESDYDPPDSGSDPTTTPEAENGKQSGSSTAESIIVEVEPYDSDVDGDGSMSSCGNGGNGHELPDDTYYINTWDNNEDDPNDDGDDQHAYHDSDDDDVYEDDDGDSSERQTDCMGTGDEDVEALLGVGGDGVNEIHNKTTEDVSNGTFDSGNDANGNGVDDVTITIDQAADSEPPYAGGVCVSDSSEADGWMAPFIIR